MTATEWTWLIAGVIGALIIGGLILWGFSYVAREQRRIRIDRRPDYESPRSTAGSKIQWGDRVDASPVSPSEERILWGAEQEPDWQWVAASPINDADSDDDERVKCPICRLKLDEIKEQIVVCPQCNTPYHKHCLAEMNYKCSICGRKIA
jgi:DNA-directed RNA polymerase subunit RPC12/RpoP